MIPAVGELDRYCLHRSNQTTFCYRPTSHVLLRATDGFAAPVCDAHVEAAQLALSGRLEVIPLELWLAECRGDGPGAEGR